MHKIHYQVCSLARFNNKDERANARQCSKRANIPGAGAGLSKKEEEEKEE